MEGAVLSIATQYTVETLVLALVVLLLVYALQEHLKWKKRYCFPPGPKGLPVLGIFHEIYDYPAHLAYTAYTKDHGAIFTANVMGRKTVILNDTETVREAMLQCSPAVDDRPSWRYCFIQLLKGLSVLPYSRRWINTKRRTVTILREYGMGKSFLEPQIYEEARAVIANILRNCDDGKANITMKKRMGRVPLNIICNMLFSERYDYDDESLMFIIHTMEYLLTFLRTACVHDSLPNFLRPIMNGSLSDFHSNIKVLHEFLHSKVEYHLQTYQDGVTRDFVDAWIKSEKMCRLKAMQQADITNNNFVQKDLRNISPSEALSHSDFSPVTDVLQDVLFAGAHSSGYAMNWLIMFITIRKDIQDRVYNAIVNVIGPTNRPTMNDKAKLPIVEAVIHETLRVSTLVPLVGHACYTDVTIQGYRLPKNTEVTYNNWAINHNEENFPDAHSFLPERWITTNGAFDRHLATKFFPFGIGKRTCAGERLARTELFLLAVTLLQNLEFLKPDESVGQEYQPEIKHVQSFVLEPKLYKVRVKRRPFSAL